MENKKERLVLTISLFKAVRTSFISEPSAAPLNVRGHDTSSTSILVTWDDDFIFAVTAVVFVSALYTP